MKRLILDTNVLLNGVFDPLSFSGQVLAYIAKGDLEGNVLEIILSEARKIISRAELNTGLSLQATFAHVMRSLQLNIVTPVSFSEIEKFRKIGGVEEDAAVAAAAERDGLIVCTNDDDFYVAKEMGVSVVDPAEAVHVGEGYEMNTDIFFPAFLNTASEGALYVEVKTCWGDLIDGKIKDKWTILDAVGIGEVSLDLDSESIAYRVDNEPELHVQLNNLPSGDFILKFIVSYSAEQGIGIYMGPGNPSKKIIASWNPENTTFPTKVTFFHGRRKPFGAPVKINKIAGFSRYLSEKGANRLLSGKQPILPQERRPLEEIIQVYYS